MYSSLQPKEYLSTRNQQQEKTTRIIQLLRDKLIEKHGTRREVVTDHYESNPNCFTDKRLAKHGGLEEMRAPGDANNVIIRSINRINKCAC